MVGDGQGSSGRRATGAGAVSCVRAGIFPAKVRPGGAGGIGVGLELDCQVNGTTARVELRGDVDMATAPELRRTLEELIDDGATEVVLDCRHLEFLDSSGIGTLVAARTRIGAEGVIALEAPRANVRRVLEVTGVDQDLSIRP